MLALSVPRWLEAVGGMLLGFALFIGFAVLFGLVIARLGGPWVDRAKAQLAREQAGAERYGWHPGADVDGQLLTAGRRIFAPTGSCAGSWSASTRAARCGWPNSSTRPGAGTCRPHGSTT